MTSRVLVAGVGNVFLGDDGFGVEVARRLAGEPLPSGVRVADFGIRSVHLAYELLDGGYDVTVLVDAAPRGDEPGTLYVRELEPLPRGSTDGMPAADAHRMTPDSVLAWLAALGSGSVGRIVLVGCEPADLGAGMALSDPVARAVERAVGVVRDLVRQTDGERSAIA